MTRVLLALVISLITAPVWAACSGSSLSYTCTAGSTVANVNTALSSASDGATITFAAGSYSWTSGSITFSNTKGVTLACATVRGCTATVGSNSVLYMDSLSGNNTKLYRITGFVFQNASGLMLWFYGNGTMNNCRIDHNTFQNFATSTIALFFGEVSSVGKFKCVIDNNIFSGANNFMSLKYLGPGDPAEWASALRGTADNVFVEDNTYDFTTASDLGSGCVDIWSAGAIVFRHNSTKNCLVTAHGVTHGATVNFEAYENTLQRTASSGGWEDGTRLFHHQGSGEIFVWGNSWVHTGTIGGTALSITHYRSATAAAAGYDDALGRCSGAAALDQNTSGQQGYACWMQPGRAPAGGSPGYGTLSPVYAWMNTDASNNARVPIAIENPWGATSPAVEDHIVANRDYYDAVSNAAQTSASSPFGGATGMGFGIAARRPATCTTNSAESGGGVGYWATDEGEWNNANAGPDGRLYRCSATNTWTLHYTPYTYPHPLRAIPAAPTNVRE